MSKLPMIPPRGDSASGEESLGPVSSTRLIERSVLTSVGRPLDLYEVSVRPLWGDYYRVNVLVGRDPTSLRIAHSYFVEARVNGEILSAVPRINRSYP